MTLRLVLVGLVAALGLTIPQWSNSTNRNGSPRAAGIVKIKDQNKQTSVRTVQTRLGDLRGLRKTDVVASTKNPPIGFGAGVSGPNANAHGNFRRVAGSLRPFQLANHAVSANQILKMLPLKSEDNLEFVTGPPAHLRRTPTVFQPIELPGELEDGIAFALNHSAEGVGKLPWPRSMLRNEFRLVRDGMEGLDTFAAIEKVVKNLPPAPPRPVEPILTAAVTMLNANVDVAMADLAARMDRSRTMVDGLARDLRDHLTMQDVRRLAVVRIVTSPLVATLPALPEDVFAPVAVAQVVQAPVAPVLAAAVKVAEPAKLAELPEDVFAPMARTQVSQATPAPVATVPTPAAPETVVAKAVEPAKLPELPDNVFAPEVLSKTQIAAEEPAPEASPLPDDVLAKPGSEPVVGKVTTQVVGPSAPTSAAGDVKATAASEKRIENPSRLKSAVALTREAAVAWMKVFSESPVVTMAR